MWWPNLFSRKSTGRYEAVLPDTNIDEKSLPLERVPRVQYSRVVVEKRYIAFGFALLTLLGLLLLKVFLPKQMPKMPPDFPTEGVLFREFHSYMEPWSRESDQLWYAVIPTEDGLVQIKDPEQYGLSPGHPNSLTNETKIYQVSWTHQYHCLATIRKEFWELIWGTSELIGADIDSAAVEHARHCFDYIRQCIVCHADMTLDGFDGTRENRNRFIGGNPHQCKKMPEIAEWMQERGVPRAQMLYPDD